ncbi:MAG: bifunctional (p)ppGpp synthetase/guanosine-3',5'-bis(diphosphate) 3'-pyrophosphohydrolase [Bdellovibrionota bacterium]|nr:MAG: bifunctional (p)ppGpp synthetase/guanosine-3',5'-bis(diphosphate) 3'-pyrophosphohydrolase [Bdellovibrionota bacterium]
MDFEKIASAVQRYHPNPDLDLLRRAYDFASEHHRSQVRASGEPYLTHLVETALLACELKLDVASVAAALLHDTIEDCTVEREKLAKLFGDEVADIVEGVTKLTRIEFDSTEERQAENFRKMLIAMAQDIRVVLVKLCDRLHNMRTLQYVREEKRRRKAQETKDIYAPLANRLGLHWVKSELEDLCLLYLRPEIYRMLRERLEVTQKERDEYIEQTTREISRLLEEAGVSGSVSGRAKHVASIWAKMERDNLSFEEVYDVLGFRIVVSTLRACYESLGIIHSSFKPVPGRFKDYIAMPKPNMYQSLHTTVIGPGGHRIEIQIRTPEMHRIAEEGIAAHWRYKEGGAPAFDLQWVRDLVETQQYLRNPDEFIQSVKGELFPEEVFVFTPKGDLLRLVYASTPVDFAYAVHTDVGHRTTGAKVNGAMVPLDHRLRNGDTVEIITSKSHVPSKDWLKFVKTSKAKQRIRAFLKSEERARSVVVGSELLSKDLRKVKQSLKKLESSGKLLTVAEEMGYKTEGDLFADIGYGKLPVTRVVAKLLPEGESVEEPAAKVETPLERIFQRAAKASRQKVGVSVNGFDDILVRFARCCEPLPGDRIVGFITRGRGVTVHAADCSHVLNSDPQRQVEVVWDNDVRAQRRIRLVVHSHDQMGLLANVSHAITTNGANINSAQCRTTGLGKAVNAFEITIADASQLERIKRAIEMVAGVIKVERARAQPGEEESASSTTRLGAKEARRR